MQFKLLSEAVWRHDNLTQHFLKHCLNDPPEGDSQDASELLMREFGGKIGNYHHAKAAYAETAERLSNADAEEIELSTVMKPGVVYGFATDSNRGTRYVKAMLSHTDNNCVDMVMYSRDGVILSFYRVPIRKFYNTKLRNKVGNINPASDEQSVEESSDDV